MNFNLIFLHGGPGYNDYLRNFFDGQFSPTIRTTFYTQKQSPSVTIEILIKELTEIVTQGSGSAVLVGHSWGGVLAGEYFRRTADPVVKGLVFIDSYLCTNDVTVEYEKELARRNLNDPSFEEIFFTQREMPIAESLIAQLEKAFDELSFRALWDGFVSNFDNSKWAKSVSLPVLNIFGEDDIRVPSAIIRSYARLNKRIQNFEIKGAGHFPFVMPEDRDRVVSAITSFIKKLPD